MQAVRVQNPGARQVQRPDRCRDYIGRRDLPKQASGLQKRPELPAAGLHITIYNRGGPHVWDNMARYVSCAAALLLIAILSPHLAAGQTAFEVRPTSCCSLRGWRMEIAYIWSSPKILLGPLRPGLVAFIVSKACWFRVALGTLQSLTGLVALCMSSATPSKAYDRCSDWGSSFQGGASSAEYKQDARVKCGNRRRLSFKRSWLDTAHQFRIIRVISER